MKDILVTGGSGQLGKALQEILPYAYYLSSSECDLTDERQTSITFNVLKPKIVIHLAARVGGIIDNMNNQHEYLLDNLKINNNVIDNCHKHKINRFISILSTCIFPDKMEESCYPMKEEDMFNGRPTETNFGYALAKRTLSYLIDSHNAKFGTKWQYLTPCNLFGEHDKIGSHSHFVSGMIEKIVKAENNKDKKITLFGDGSPYRQFVYAKDLAVLIKKCIFEDIAESFNVAPLENYTIKEMAEKTLKAIGSDLKIEWDTTKPNGQLRKDVSNEKMTVLFPHFKFTPYEQAIVSTYNSFKTRLNG